MSFLNDKVAIITGDAQGIGTAIAEALVEAGAEVVLADIDDSPGRAWAERMGTAALYVHAGFSHEEQIREVITKAVEAFGGVDILVNIVVNPIGVEMTASPEAWLVSYATNVIGPALLIQAIRPVMQRRGRGVIILGSEER